MYTKKDLVSKVSEKLDKTKKDSEVIVDTVIESIKDLIADEAEDGLDLYGFCKFQVVEQKARTARNPKTGETIEVPAKDILKVKLPKKMKNLDL